MRHVGNRYLFEDDATTMDAYTTADVYAFVDVPGKDLAIWTSRPAHHIPRANLTNAIYAAFPIRAIPIRSIWAPADPELAVSAKW